MGLCRKDKCTVCGACISVCPQNCICFYTDEFGFSYPKIDNEKCVDCGMCKRVCHVENEVELNCLQKAQTVW